MRSDQIGRLIHQQCACRRTSDVDHYLLSTIGNTLHSFLFNHYNFLLLLLWAPHCHRAVHLLLICSISLELLQDHHGIRIDSFLLLLDLARLLLKLLFERTLFEVYDLLRADSSTAFKYFNLCRGVRLLLLTLEHIHGRGSNLWGLAHISSFLGGLDLFGSVAVHG